MFSRVIARIGWLWKLGNWGVGGMGAALSAVSGFAYGGYVLTLRLIQFLIFLVELVLHGYLIFGYQFGGSCGLFNFAFGGAQSQHQTLPADDD